MLKVCESSISNLYLMIWYWLTHFQTYKKNCQPSSLKNFTLSNLHAKHNLKMQNKIMVSWWQLLKELSQSQRSLHDKLMSEPFWWSTFTSLISARFYRLNAIHLQWRGMEFVGDTMTNNCFLMATKAIEQFGLLFIEFGT